MSNPLTSCVRLRLETSKKGKTTIYARIYKKFTWANLSIADLPKELWDTENNWPVLDSRTERVRARLIATRTLAADLLQQYINQNILDGPTFKEELLSKIASWESQNGNLASPQPEDTNAGFTDPLVETVQPALSGNFKSEKAPTCHYKIQDLILAYQAVIRPNLAEGRKSHYRTLAKYLSDFEIYLNRNHQEQESVGLSTQGGNIIKKLGCRIDLLDEQFHTNLVFFLRLPEERGGKSLGNSTISWYLSMLRTVIRFFKRKPDYKSICTDTLFLDLPQFENQHFYATYEQVYTFAQVDFKQLILGKEPTADYEIGDEECAKLLSVSSRTLQNYVNEKGLPLLRTENKYTQKSRQVYSIRNVWSWYLNFKLGTQVGQLIRSMEIARDLFCFTCQAPARHGDIVQWTRFNLINTTLKDGNQTKAIRFRANKNGKWVTLPLNSYCLSIIKKYDGHPACKGKLLPFPTTNQVLNKNIKKALYASGIFNELVTYYQFTGDASPTTAVKPLYLALSFHSTRHTFATNMLALGLNREYVKEAMGHKSIKTLEIYSHIIETEYTTSTLDALESAHTKMKELVTDGQAA